MEVLDTSIANVALPHMAGDLGASNDESTWVLTSYLVSNAIVLPISGWLANLFGRKRFFMLCIFLFTLSSLLCGIAPSLPMLILFRVIQGVGGGGLQPMAQAILADTFPAAETRPGVRAVRNHRHHGAHHRPHAGRLAHRQLFLALDLLYQSARRNADPVSGAADGGGSAVSRPHQERRRARRLHRHFSSRAGCGRAPGPARQGPGRRLVRFALHRRAGGDLGRLPDFAGSLGVAHARRPSSTCGCSRASTSPWRA